MAGAVRRLFLPSLKYSQLRMMISTATPRSNSPEYIPQPACTFLVWIMCRCVMRTTPCPLSFVHSCGATSRSVNPSSGLCNQIEWLPACQLAPEYGAASARVQGPDNRSRPARKLSGSWQHPWWHHLHSLAVGFHRSTCFCVWRQAVSLGGSNAARDPPWTQPGVGPAGLCSR